MPSGEVLFNNHQSFLLEKFQIPASDFSPGSTGSRGINGFIFTSKNKWTKREGYDREFLKRLGSYGIFDILV